MPRRHPRAPLTENQKREFYRGTGRELEKLAGSIMDGLQLFGEFENSPVHLIGSELAQVVECARQYCEGVLLFFEAQRKRDATAGLNPVQLARQWRVNAKGEVIRAWEALMPGASDEVTLKLAAAIAEANRSRP